MTKPRWKLRFEHFAREFAAFSAQKPPWHRSARELATESARNKEMLPPARNFAAFSAQTPPWHRSARESVPKPAWKRLTPNSARKWGIISGAEQRNVAACAGFHCYFRSEAYVAPFCAGMGYHFRRGKEKSCRLRKKTQESPEEIPATVNVSSTPEGKILSAYLRSFRVTRQNRDAGIIHCCIKCQPGNNNSIHFKILN